MRFIDHGQGGGPEVLVSRTCPVPTPGEGEILVRVAYAGVNRPEALQRKGLYAPPPGASTILGLEVSGEVVSLGGGATRWSVGDKVCALTNGGAYAEYVVVPEGQALPVPAGLSMLQAAALPENFFTVWANVFQRGGLRRGESFLVHGGSSGIGLTAIQLAKAFGASVLCTVGNAEKAAACKAAGADIAINYRDQDFVDVALKATEGRGMNVVLDMVGGTYVERNLRALAVEGRLVQISFLESSRPELDWTPLMVKRITFTGSTLRPRSLADKTLIGQELVDQVWPLLSAKRIAPVIHKVFPMDQASHAHALMESSEHIGKIMLEV
ncbi:MULTISPECIES: NAD(P)H-quinone oxidoreductase [unclassified Hydrogenophaga]|uniref:NAD(P)H-quinone oxidoreductase n=1 Tax=unclassified Hydrogenophaga TaxID=2610897 RepID=UPI0009E8A4C9|nr:NAD(P)H-quinone oxidoreductase [Hydrogenophaga sp. Root209]